MAIGLEAGEETFLLLWLFVVLELDLLPLATALMLTVETPDHAPNQ